MDRPVLEGLSGSPLSGSPITEHAAEMIHLLDTIRFCVRWALTGCYLYGIYFLLYYCWKLAWPLLVALGFHPPKRHAGARRGIRHASTPIF